MITITSTITGTGTAAAAKDDASEKAYEGTLDLVGPDVIEGWAWNRNDEAAPVQVDVYDGGTRLWTLTADGFRPDLLQAGIGNGMHQFLCRTPPSLKDGRIHTIEARIAGTNISLAGSPRAVVFSRPIFIIGAPRSGTTILAWALAEHSQLWTSDEAQILCDLFDDGQRLESNYQRDGRYEGSWLLKQGVTRTDFLSFVGLGLNALFSSRSGGKRWIEHTPSNAFLSASLADMFPGAIFLHILRDGRRVVHSMLNYAKLIPGAARQSPERTPVFPPWSVDFRQACRTWSRFVEASLRLGSLFPDRCLTVRHEELTARPEALFADILDFIEAPFEETPAKYFQANRLNTSFPRELSRPAGAQDRDDVWQSWSDEQRSIFREEAGATARKCGFDVELDGEGAA